LILHAVAKYADETGPGFMNKRTVEVPAVIWIGTPVMLEIRSEPDLDAVNHLSIYCTFKEVAFGENVSIQANLDGIEFGHPCERRHERFFRGLAHETQTRSLENCLALLNWRVNFA